MDGITLTLRDLHHGESHLARMLPAVAERHSTEHEVHHVAIDLARWSRTHAERIAAAGADYGLHLNEEPHRPGGLLDTLREKVAEAVGRRPAPGLLLLHDLRELYLAASGTSLLWEMLAQAARASRDTRLLELSAGCHPQTLRQIRWCDTMIKVLSPQVLTSL